MEHPGIGHRELLRMLYKTVDDMEAFSDTSNTYRPRYHICGGCGGIFEEALYMDLLYRSMEDVEGFFDTHNRYRHR